MSYYVQKNLKINFRRLSERQEPKRIVLLTSKVVQTQGYIAKNYFQKACIKKKKSIMLDHNFQDKTDKQKMLECWYYLHTHTQNLVNLFNKYLWNFVPDIVPSLLLYLFLSTLNLEIGRKFQ